MTSRQKEGWTYLPPLQVLDEVVREIEDIQFERRFPNRSEALREIIKQGIAAMKAQEKAPKP